MLSHRFGGAVIMIEAEKLLRQYCAKQILHEMPSTFFHSVDN